jgi:hypothetical protein
MTSIPSVQSYVAHFCDEIITFFGDWRELSWALLQPISAFAAHMVAVLGTATR